MMNFARRIEPLLLEVSDLRVSFRATKGEIVAVKGITFSMGRERLGVVGESGSGKSIMARSLVGVLPPTAIASAALARFNGVDLDLESLPARRQTARRIGMVLQDPKFSLNPLMTVATQLCEMFAIHKLGGRDQAVSKGHKLLTEVGLSDPARVMRSYPHELSGGMAQRAMIAMMLMSDPDLLIADEPTSALDVTVKVKVLQTMDRLVQQRGMGLILISHDLNLVSRFCDRILVMYRGAIVETLAATDLQRAQHPYTQALLNSLPRLDRAVPRLAVHNREVDLTLGSRDLATR